MRRLDTFLFLAFITSATACSPKDPADADSDTDTETSGNPDTADTTPTEAGETEDPTGETEDPGEEFPACEPPTDLDVAFRLNQGDWAVVDPDIIQPVSIHALCSVTSVARNGTTADIGLTCTDEAFVGPADLTLSLTMPADAPLTLSEGMDVQLRYEDHPEGHHDAAGSQFAVRDAMGTELLIAGFTDDGGLNSWNDLLMPLTVEAASEVCPCDDGDCFDVEGDERLAVTAKLGNAEITVVDANRGTLMASSPYEILVGAAVHHHCLNCNGSYRVLITS